MTLRVILYIIGGITLSVGVAFALRATWIGAGAYDLLAEIVAEMLGFSEITMGYYVLGTIALAIGLLLTKERLYLFSFIPFVTLSPIVDIALLYIPQANTWLIQIAFFIIGMYLIALGVGVFINIKSPITPIDVCAMGIKKRLKFKTFGPGKIILDIILIALLVGLSYFVVGENRLGVGTFLYCFILGPVIDVNTHLLKKPIEKLVYKI